MHSPTPPLVEPLAPRSNAVRAAGLGQLPRTLGPYTLFEQIGQGGMASIFLARAETSLGATRLTVVKQILPEFAEDPRFAEMLIHEAKLAARLNHGRVVQVFDLGRVDDELFIAMEYVEGMDLNGLLRHCTRRKIGLPLVHALRIVSDVLEGLEYAHRLSDDKGSALGIIHRDVSPSNVLISFDGEVKLCDFGIAAANDLVDRWSADVIKGKAGYMSPEHARGEALDARADVFAAGILLWELLSGHRMYRAQAGVSLLDQARHGQAPPLTVRDLPNFDDLERIVFKALASNPDDRYPSASAFMKDLDRYAEKSSLLANPLKFGEWLSSAFGTEIVDKRRASERRLKGQNEDVAPAAVEPAPAAFEASPTAPEPSPRIPAPTPSPFGDFQGSSSVPPVSLGAMRAFRRDLESRPSFPELNPSPSAKQDASARKAPKKSARIRGESRSRWSLKVGTTVAVAAGLVAIAYAFVR